MFTIKQTHEVYSIMQRKNKGSSNTKRSIRAFGNEQKKHLNVAESFSNFLTDEIRNDEQEEHNLASVIAVLPKIFFFHETKHVSEQSVSYNNTNLCQTPLLPSSLTEKLMTDGLIKSV